MDALAAIFGQKDAIGPLQECARALLIFVYGWALVRLLGRRVFGRWSALDIVVSIIVGSNLSRALTGSAPLWGTLGATTLLFAVHRALAVACAHHPQISHLVEGRAITLLTDGAWREGLRKREGISEADIRETLRQSGLDDEARVASITLEPSGKLTVLERS